MANQDGLAVNENPIQNPNQAQGNAQTDNQEQNPPPHNPFLSMVNQRKMWKPICLGQMTGWTHMTFWIM